MVGTIPAHVRAALLPPPEQHIDEWAEENIVIPFGGERGPFSLDRAPYVRELFRMVKHPDVEEITLMAAAQVTKTIFCQIVLLYYMCEEPDECLHVMPKKEDTVSLNVDRYQKIIKASPKLAALLTDSSRDMTRAAIRFTNGSALHFASAQSPSDLAMRTIGRLVLDECDKYVEFSGREADPISLAKERTERRTDRKIIKASTPLTDHGYINQEFLAGDQRRYHVPCPHCGVYQTLVMSQVKWPEKETDPERLLDHGLAWYECRECKERISDLDKAAILRRGVWCPASMWVSEDGELTGDPPPLRRLSYHLSRLYSPSANHSFSRIAAEFLRSQKVEAKRMNFQNSWLAEVYQDKVEELKDAHLRARVSAYAQGTRPVGVKVITAGVDVQENSLWYVIRGWGSHGQSWLIRFGSVETWAQLELVLSLNPGQQQPYGYPRYVFIDSKYAARKGEVYRFCKRTGALAIIGAGGMPMRDYARLGKVETEDGWKLPRLVLDMNHYRENLHRLIHRRDDEPGAWHLPNDLPESYFAHLVAEQRVIEKDARTQKSKVVWKVVHSHARNEAFDCEVYAYAAAEIRSLLDLTGDPLPKWEGEIPEVKVEAQPVAAPETVSNQPKRPRITHVRSNLFSRSHETLA